MAQDSAIAIVGMAGRFPGAANVGELWRNLRDGVESLTFWSDEELLEAGVDPALLTDPSYVKACFYLPDQGDFDAGFFEIGPREAELTDPQQRIFLELAWEALEDAGIEPARYPGAIAVYAGAGRTHYMTQHLLASPEVLERMGVVNVYLANEKDFLATRVSYKLDLKGPSVTVQTACSSSLVGVHLGAQALLGGECDVALAGGVCLAALKPEGYHCVEGGVFAPDGHVRAFDRRAGGQVGGNGAAIVVLKRLEDALRDGDSIRAVLRGSALNNDGVQKVSFSAPGVEGQARVIAEALAVSGVDPRTIGFVEAHGTGTALGDPIEVRALTRAWRQWTDARGFCALGSIKTNIGHLDAGAGAAGVIKAALALQHGLIPPSLNYDVPNPEIDFAASPFFVNTEPRPWPRGAEPRRAAVSSFGMGGTNAHVILEEAPTAAPTSAGRGLELLCVSARGDRPLEAATANLAKHLEAHRDLSLADAAFTAQVGRRAFRRRRIVLAKDRIEAANALRKLDKKRSLTGTASERPLPVGFLFSGQGAQHPGMLAELYATERTYRVELDRCLELLRPLLDHDLRPLLFPAAGGEARAAELLARTENTQPALFAVEWALVQLWTEWGVVPAALLGHSIGEFVAAALAGVVRLEGALRLVAARGRAIGALPAGGAMLAVPLGEAELTARLGPELAVAAVNAPELVVVSGPEAAVAELEAELAREGLAARRLHTSHAFHSPLMDPCLAEFRAAVREVELAAPKLAVVSCTTGQWLSASEATDPEYWVRHLRQPVRFARGLATLAERCGLLLEVGPGDSLAALARAGRQRLPVVASARHPKDPRGDVEVLLFALGELWVHGAEVDWRGVHRHEQRRRVPLPTYPWEHRRYWIDPPRADEPRIGRKARRTPDPADWFYTPSWRRAELAPSASAAAGSWLILPDRGGLAQRVAEALSASGASVRIASAPAPGVADLRAAFDAHGVPDRIVDLCGVDPLEPRTPALVERAAREAFEGPLALGQALAERELASAVRIDLVTTGMQAVLGGDAADPEKATALGVAKAIAAELPGVDCRSVDL
jgi:acyl transferase domain-containing protein